MKKKFLLIFAVSICLLAQSAYAETITLSKATMLIPQGWSVADEDLKFKKDSTAELNAQGEVISGILNKNTYLRPTGWRSLINDYCFVESSAGFFPRFFYPLDLRYGVTIPTYGHVRYSGDRLVEFAADGTVLRGVIDHKVTLTLDKDKYGFVDFKSGTILAFDQEGHVAHGTLSGDTYLRPVGWQEHSTDKKNAGFLLFKSSTTIDFNANGEVISGTLKEASAWKQADGTPIALPDKKLIHFNSDGAKIEMPEK